MKKRSGDVNSMEEAYLVRRLGSFGVGSGFELGQAQDGY